jgi:ligand-binding sensor domain-containing protein
MKKMNRLWHLHLSAVILILPVLFSACEETPEGLLDPDTAGVWTLYNTENSGLPGNSVAGLASDHEGNIWIACPGNGIAKLSDKSWTTFNSSNSGLLSDDVTAIECAETGKIVIGTKNGISIYSPSGTWSSYIDPLVTVMEVNSVASTSDGSIWIGTYNEGLYIKDETIVSHTNTGTTVYAFEEDSRGDVWVGASSGLLRWNGTAWTNITITEKLPAGSVTSLLSDTKSRLWFGIYNSDKVWWRDNTGVHSLSLMTGLPGNDIRDICEDSRGDIWFATYGAGLVRYDGVVPWPYKNWLTGSAENIPENNINCIVRDKNGTMWFGLATKGLLKYTLPIE